MPTLIFENLFAPQAYNQKHNVLNIVFLLLIAVISGQIAGQKSKCLENVMWKYCPFKQGIPIVYTKARATSLRD